MRDEKPGKKRYLLRALRYLMPHRRIVFTSIACAFVVSLAFTSGLSTMLPIVRLLINRQACVCGEIVDQLPLAQSTVSQHLKILKESGLIQGEVDGPKVCYCINETRLKELKALIGCL